MGEDLHDAMLGGLRSAMLGHVSLWYRDYEYELQTLAVEKDGITNHCSLIGVYYLTCKVQACSRSIAIEVVVCLWLSTRKRYVSEDRLSGGKTGLSVRYGTNAVSRIATLEASGPKISRKAKKHEFT